MPPSIYFLIAYYVIFFVCTLGIETIVNYIFSKNEDKPYLVSVKSLLITIITALSVYLIHNDEYK